MCVMFSVLDILIDFILFFFSFFFLLFRNQIDTMESTESDDSVSLPWTYSSVVHLPSLAGIGTVALSTNTSGQLYGLQMTLKGATTNSLSKWIYSNDNEKEENTSPTFWWSFNSIPPPLYTGNAECKLIPKDKTEGIFFAVNSDKSIGGAVPSWIPGSGIIPVYTFLILYVGSYVRSFLFNPIYNVPFTEIPHPDVLLEICEGVEIMRASQYEGHRKDEVGLYNFLLSVIKSSVMLRRITEE